MWPFILTYPKDVDMIEGSSNSILSFRYSKKCGWTYTNESVFTGYLLGWKLHWWGLHPQAQVVKTALKSDRAETILSPSGHSFLWPTLWFMTVYPDCRLKCAVDIHDPHRMHSNDFWRHPTPFTPYTSFTPRFWFPLSSQRKAKWNWFGLGCCVADCGWVISSSRACGQTGHLTGVRKAGWLIGASEVWWLKLLILYQVKGLSWWMLRVRVIFYCLCYSTEGQPEERNSAASAVIIVHTLSDNGKFCPLGLMELVWRNQLSAAVSMSLYTTSRFTAHVESKSGGSLFCLIWSV